MPLPTPTLQTARLLLRPFDDGDREAIFALQSNARVMRWWNSPPWTERSQADAFLASCRRMADEGSGAKFALQAHEDGAFVGWCSMFGWNPVYRSLGIGYCLAEVAWGRGLATEAVRAMLQWAYGALDLNRVDAELDTRNPASARVLEKLGFQREGLRREDCIVSGEVSDSWIYGLLRRDFQVGPQAVKVLASGGGDDAPERPAAETIHLVPLRADEYADFFETAVAAYAHDNVQSGRWSAADAAALSRDETARLLPDGAATPGHHLFAMHAADGGPARGYLWYATLPRGSARVAYVYQLNVKPAHRRRGHARSALLQAEVLARVQGHDTMALNVFASNPGAQALYRSVGYRFTAHSMAKDIGSAGDG